jgi:hypothetical protein
MQFNRLKVFYLVLCLVLTTSLAWAQESGGAGKTQHPDSAEWYKRTQRLTALESKIKEETKNLQSLIQKKNQGQRFIRDEKNNSIDLLEAIVVSHRGLQATHDAYEKERIEIKYRFPGEDGLVERRYMSLRPPSLEQVEKELGLDGQLNQLSQKIGKKYQVFMPEPSPSAQRVDDPESTLKNVKKDQADQRLRLTK